MKVYLAGKIRHTDWRHGLVPSMRSIAGRDPWFPAEMAGDFIGHVCVGPFFTSCDHGCGHGEGHHGNFQCERPHGSIRELIRKQTYDKCMAAVRGADLVYAWFDPKDTDAYGTLFELGYAVGLGKRVVVATGWDGGLVDSIWFALMGAEFIVADSPRDGLLRALSSVE
jgi:hypothetical protein